MPPTDPNGGNPFYLIENTADAGVRYSPKISAYTLGDMNTKVTPGKWFHLMIAVDTSATLSYGSPYHKVAISVNGDAYADLGGPSNGIYNPTYQNGNCPSTIDDSSGFFFFGPFIATSASAVGTTSRNIPGYDFVLSGEEVGLPSYPDSVWGTNDKVVQVADVQIWVDQFIDPTDHISKFMKPDVDDPAKPRLVDPSVAETAFGKPTFFFDGPPSKFATNRGSGGQFTKVGDLKKFIPYPPKAPAPTP